MSNTGEEHGAADLGLTRAVWRKSSYSGGNGSCVEIAHLGTAVAIRDSKDPEGPVLIATADVWHSFIRHIKGQP
jgi:hypothetical protein